MKKPAVHGLFLIAAAGLLAATAGLWVLPSGEPEGREGLGCRSKRSRSDFHQISPPTGSSRLSGIVQLAETDPLRAKREITALPASRERDEAVLSVADEWVRTDFHGAIELAETLPPSPPRDEVLERAVREWALSDPGAAIAHAKSVSEESLRERLFGAALVEWSGSDPAAAATLAANELLEGRIQDNAITSIAMRWARQDPGAVAAWIGRFPEGELKQNMVESVSSVPFDQASADGSSKSISLPCNLSNH